MKKVFKFLSITMLFVLMASIVPTNIFNKKVLANAKTQTINLEDPEIVVKEDLNLITVSVYINGKLDHISKINKQNGNIEELKNGKISLNNVKNFTNENTLESKENVIMPRAEVGEYFIASGRSYLSSTLIGGLWGKDRAPQYGTARVLKISSGTLVGTAVGLLISLIPVIGQPTAIAVLNALGASISGAVIGSYVDGQVYVKDMITDLRVSVNGETTYRAWRGYRYVRSYNAKNGTTSDTYHGQIGDWNDNSTHIHRGIQAYINMYGY